MGQEARYRQAYDQNLHGALKIKNKFLNMLFVNRQIKQVTFRSTLVCFLIVFAVFLALAIFFFVEVGKVDELELRYYEAQSSTCSIGSTCQYNFQITDSMRSPIYVMYKLGNYYQGTRSYYRSKNNYQLAGNTITPQQAVSCEPYVTNAQMGVTTSWNGTPLNPQAIASPCGYIAKTFFTDTFQLFKGTQRISIDEKDIAWEGDKGDRFKRGPQSQLNQWIDPQNQHFIVWMRTSGMPNFKKPWGIIDQDLQAGQYTLKVKHNYSTPDWSSDRYFVLSTLSFVGGINYILPLSFLIVAVLSLLAFIYFCRRFSNLPKYSE